MNSEDPSRACQQKNRGCRMMIEGRGAEGRAEGRVKSVISGKSGQIKHSNLGKRSNDAHIVISRSPEMTEG